METVTWFIRGTIEKSDHDLTRLARYRMRKDVKPVEVRLSMSTAPSGSPTKIDIKADGVSIFTDTGVPQVDQLNTFKVHDVFNPTGAATIKAESLVTLTVDAIGSTYGVRDLTVELDLEYV